MSGEEQPTGKATARIHWRKLLVPSLLIMVLPTVSALLLDRWLGTLPLITIVVILICFPLATFLVIRIALQEMDRVIAEVAPMLPPELSGEPEQLQESEAEPKTEVATDSQDGSSSTA